MSLSEFLPQTLAEAVIIQKNLAKKVILEDRILYKEIQLVTGVDVSNSPHDVEKKVFSTAVTVDRHSLEVIESHSTMQYQPFPYRTGFLGFREVPGLIQTIQELKNKPSLILVDGHGVSHPRKFGVATHLGVLLDIPTIGVAKSILIGKPADVLGEEKGSTTPLIWKGETIGMLLRSKERCLPLIISSGHMVSLDSSVEIVLSLITKYRLPEPTRQAHIHANLFRKSFQNT